MILLLAAFAFSQPTGTFDTDDPAEDTEERLEQLERDVDEMTDQVADLARELFEQAEASHAAVEYGPEWPQDETPVEEEPAHEGQCPPGMHDSGHHVLAEEPEDGPDPSDG